MQAATARWAFITVLATSLASVAPALEAPARAQSNSRCDHCNMVVRADSRWLAGGRSAEGDALQFDSPKCFFSYHHRHDGGVRNGWMTDYERRERVPAARLFFVLGSDRRGPMGRDVVPFDSLERARRFAREHHASRVLRFEHVTAETVRSLFHH